MAEELRFNHHLELKAIKILCGYEDLYIFKTIYVKTPSFTADTVQCGRSTRICVDFNR